MSLASSNTIIPDIINTGNMNSDNINYINTGQVNTINMNRNSTVHYNQNTEEYNNALGLLCAISSSIFIGTYWIINKKSLEQLEARNNTRNHDHQELNLSTPQAVLTNITSSTDLSSSRVTGEKPSLPISSENRTRHYSDSQRLTRDERERGPINSNNHNYPTRSRHTSNYPSGTHKKKALKYEFLTSRLWWFGICCMALGEMANFCAYIFSPASLVTPLGALSVVVTCVLSVYFLDERMNILSKLGVLLATLGSAFIVIHAPKQKKITNIEDLKNIYIAQPSFIGYTMIVITVMLILCFTQNRHYFCRILLSSLAGGFCVISTKCLGIAGVQLTEMGFWPGLASLFSNWFFYVMILSLVSSMILQIVQITRALNDQSASTVMPIFYITFTISVVTGMNVLFQEYRDMDLKEVFSVFLGFAVLCCAVFLLQSFSKLPIYQYEDIQRYGEIMKEYKAGFMSPNSRSGRSSVAGSHYCEGVYENSTPYG